MSNVNLLDKTNYFSIGGFIKNIRQREYNGNITKYLMIEDFTDARYPNYFEVEFYGDKADLVANIQAGDTASFSVNLGGRQWIDKNTMEIKGTFFSFKGWKVNEHKKGAVQAPPQQQAQQAPPQQQYQPAPVQNFNEELQDDIPF